jgi:hypothetical protein
MGKKSKGLRKARCVRKKMAHGLGKLAARKKCGVRGA